MKKVILISFALLAATVLEGQDSIRFTNSYAFLELGGAGLLSANYERTFPINGKARFSGRAGIGMYPTDLGLFGARMRWGAVLPLKFNFMYGRTFSLEAGLGLSVGFYKAEDIDGNDSFINWYNGNLGL